MAKRILNLLPAELISLSKEDFLAAVAGIQQDLRAWSRLGSGSLGSMRIRKIG